MFLPNTHSFLLTREPTVKPSFSVSSPAPQNVWYDVLPNTQSFLLTRGPIVKPSFSASSSIRQNVWYGVLPSKHSFLLTQNTIVDPDPLPSISDTGTENVAGTPSETTDSQTKVSDRSKRNFLKAAGVAGAGVIASQLGPNKAQALIMGSSPTTGVVGVKDSTNTRINPATEETASSLLKTSDLTFDSGALEVKVSSTSGDGSSSFSDSGGVAKSGLVDVDRHVQVDVLSSTLPTSASTETTLETISFGGFKFTIRLATDSGDSNIEYLGEAAIGTATSAASWRIKEIDSTSGTVIQWAGTGVFDQVWDNRESLTYT